MFKKILWSFLVASGLFVASSYIHSFLYGVRSDFKSDQSLAYKIAQYHGS